MRKKRQIGLRFETGYLRRANKFKTFELDENGLIKEKKFGGNNAITFALSPIFGKVISISDHSTRLYVAPVLQLAQYNHTWLPNASLEIGLVFNLTNTYK